MSEYKPPLIHIGYHKTASTWLQKYLFENPETLFKRALRKEIRKWIVLPHALTFDPEKVKSHYLSTFDDTNCIPVISSERLSGNPYYGGYDTKEIADKLYQSFPEAKILIIIREQKSAISSSYLQYVKSGGTCSIEDFLEPRNYEPPITPWFSFEHFDYIHLAKYYIKLYGQENVLILPYEMFREKPQDFCNRIIQFSNAKQPSGLPFKRLSNKRLSALGAIPTRIANQLFVKSRFNPAAIDLKGFQHYITKAFVRLDQLIPKTLRSRFDNGLDAKVQEKIKGLYSKGNKELVDIIGIDLAAYGY